MKLKERIIEFLKQHPEGATFPQIVAYVGDDRINVIAAISEFINAGMINQRHVENHWSKTIIRYKLTDKAL